MGPMDGSICVQGVGNANKHLFPAFPNLLGGAGEVGGGQVWGKKVKQDGAWLGEGGFQPDHTSGESLKPPLRPIDSSVP